MILNDICEVLYRITLKQTKGAPPVAANTDALTIYMGESQIGLTVGSHQLLDIDVAIHQPKPWLAFAT